MPDHVSTLERRIQRHRRKTVRLPVRISSIDPEIDADTGKPCFLTAEETCGDLSRGGAFVLAAEPPRPGARLLVEVELPDGEAVQTLARVAWTRVRFPSEGPEAHTGFGVEFLGGTRQHLAAIERFVDAPTQRKAHSTSKRQATTPGPGPSA